MGLTGNKAAPLRSRDMTTKREMVLQYMKRTGSSAVRDQQTHIVQFKKKP